MSENCHNYKKRFLLLVGFSCLDGKWKCDKIVTSHNFAERRDLLNYKKH